MIKINGEKIKEPTSKTLDSYNLTKSGRVSSGKMTMELVGKKRTLQVSYEVLAGYDLEQIRRLIDGNAMFFTVEFDDSDGIHSMVAYAGAIHRDYFRSDTKFGWYWKNVEFQLIEQ